MELTTVLLVYYLALGPSPGKAELALATYEYSGAEQAMQVYAEQYPKQTRAFVANVAILASAITNQKISYTWSF